MATNDHNVICIIGMHRSGTSMVARLLQKSGLELGPLEDLWGRDPHNPLGQFEHKEFLDIDEKILTHFGGSWDSPPNFCPEWHKDHSIDGLAQKAKHLVERFAANAAWGWKEPRTTILLPFWKKIIPDLRFVVRIHNPLEVAWSLAKRNGFPIEQGGFLWQRYMRAAIEDTEGCSRLFVFYDDFFVNPMLEIEKLTKFCGLPQQQRWSSDAEIVIRELRHNTRKDLELLESRDITLESKLIYLGLRWLSSGDLEDPNCSDFHRARNPTSSGLLLRSLETLYDESSSLERERQLAEMNSEIHRLHRVLDKKVEEITNLKIDVKKLQAFSDAVRKTLAFRFYRSVIKPFRADRNS